VSDEKDKPPITYVVFENLNLDAWLKEFERRHGITRWTKLKWWFEDRWIDFIIMTGRK
jgi:hypothetical protein